MIMIIMVNGMGAPVPIMFLGDTNLFMLVTFPWLAHLYLASSGDRCAFLHLNISWI